MKMLTVALIGAIFGLSGCNHAENELSVAYVDINAALEQSGVAQQMEAHNAALMLEIQRARVKTQAMYKDMSKADAKKYAAADQKALNRLLHNRQAYLRDTTLKAVQEQAEAVRKQLGFRLVVSADQVIAAPERADITPGVVEKMKKMTIDYGKDPVVTFEKPAATPDTVGNKSSS